jgi:hypothetical protein
VLGGINLGPILGIVGGITTVTAANLNTPVVQTLLNSLSPITINVAAVASGDVNNINMTDTNNITCNLLS